MGPWTQQLSPPFSNHSPRVLGVGLGRKPGPARASRGRHTCRAGGLGASYLGTARRRRVPQRIARTWAPADVGGDRPGAGSPGSAGDAAGREAQGPKLPTRGRPAVAGAGDTFSPCFERFPFGPGSGGCSATAGKPGAPGAGTCQRSPELRLTQEGGAGVGSSTPDGVASRSLGGHVVQGTSGLTPHATGVPTLRTDHQEQEKLGAPRVHCDP